jgi:hypothetical protein
MRYTSKAPRAIQRAEMGSNVAMLNKIVAAKRLAENLSRAHPDQASWPTLFALLESYEAKAHDHWPLTPEERENVLLGWFSVRNIEDVFPQLHEQLSEVAANCRHSGE